MNMNFTPNLVVGVVLALLGLALTLDQLALIEASALLRFWPVVLVLFGASIVAQALRPTPDGAPAIGRQRPIISPGLVFLMLLVWMLASSDGRPGVNRSSDTSEETVNLVAVMSRSTSVNHAPRFRGGHMTTVMGNSQLDLREAGLAAGEEAVVEVFGLMGAVRLVVPEGWTVDVQTTPVMGTARDRRASADGRPTGAAPHLVVRGLIMMGALEIRP